MEQYKEGKYLLDFSAKWCGPCQRIKPFFEELKLINTEINFIVYDVDIDTDVTKLFNVECMPTFVAIKNGEIIERLEGSSKDKLNLIVEKLNE